MSDSTQGNNVSEWLHITNMIIGLICSVLALIIIGKFTFDNTILFQLIIIELGLIGIARIINGFYDKKIPEALGKTNIIVGLYLVIITLPILLLQNQYYAIAFFIASSGMLCISIIRLLVGRTDPRFSNTYGWIVIGAGVITALLSVYALLLELGEDQLSLTVFGVALLISGIIRTVSGLMRREADD